MPIQTINLVAARKLNDDLIQKFKAKNIFIEEIELLKMYFQYSNSTVKLLQKNQSPLVVLSEFAAKSLLHIMHTENLSLTVKNCFAIKGKTSDFLISEGFTVLEKDLNASRLAIKIISRKEKSVLIITSNLNRPDLKDSLDKHQIKNKYLYLYQKELLPFPVNPKSGILFFSPSQIMAYLQTNMVFKHLPVFCIGTTTANFAKESGFDNIQICRKASEESMYKTILNYYNIS